MIYSIEYLNRDSKHHEFFRVDDLLFHLENDYSGCAEVSIYVTDDSIGFEPELFCTEDWNAEELRFMANAFNRMANKLEKYK